MHENWYVGCWFGILKTLKLISPNLFICKFKTFGPRNVEGEEEEEEGETSKREETRWLRREMLDPPWQERDSHKIPSTTYCDFDIFKSLLFKV